MKDEVSGKIMKKFGGLRSNMLSYMIDNWKEKKKVKCQKKMCC